MFATFSPGQYVRHPDEPDWGIGQVQSAIEDRITVNFENAGKRLIISSHISLVLVRNEEMTDK